MPINALFAVCMLMQVDVPTINAPEGEYTLRKAATLTESMATIEKLHQQWKALGDPARREEGEPADRYHQRAMRSLKGKAYLLVLLGEEYERMLLARYAIEADLERFKNWIDAAAESNSALAERYRQEAEVRKKKLTDLKNQVIIIASLLKDRYLKDAETLRNDGKTEDADQAEAAARKLEPRAALAAQVFQRKPIEEKFSGMSTDDLRQRDDELGRQMISLDREARYVDQHVITTMPVLLENLDEAQKQSMVEGRKMLEKSIELEQSAADIPMVCRYLEDTLAQVQQFEGANARLVLQRRLQEQSRISKILVEFTGNATVDSVDSGVDRILGLDAEKAAAGAAPASN